MSDNGEEIQNKINTDYNNLYLQYNYIRINFIFICICVIISVQTLTIFKINLFILLVI